ncbi:MAG TPA: cupin domain-containing protein [Bryobacteraceae bacterium]|nr:cupin domain-containing protein [Bryobacteraceae bacterium]
MQRNIFTWMMMLAVTAICLNAAGVTYIPHDKVAEAISKGGDLVKAPDLIVLGSHRAGPGQVEVHDKETDVFYVIEGSATLITGGAMVGGKNSGPGQWRGADIKGGETHHLVKGDVIVIPAGTPHWFKQVSPSINYYVVKALKP